MSISDFVYISAHTAGRKRKANREILHLENTSVRLLAVQRPKLIRILFKASARTAQ